MEKIKQLVVLKTMINQSLSFREDINKELRSKLFNCKDKDKRDKMTVQLLMGRAEIVMYQKQIKILKARIKQIQRKSAFA